MFPASARVSSSALYSESQWSSWPRAVDAASRVEPLIPALSQAHLRWGVGLRGCEAVELLRTFVANHHHDADCSHGWNERLWRQLSPGADSSPLIMVVFFRLWQEDTPAGRGRHCCRIHHMLLHDQALSSSSFPPPYQPVTQYNGPGIPHSGAMTGTHTQTHNQRGMMRIKIKIGSLLEQTCSRISKHPGPMA